MWQRGGHPSNPAILLFKVVKISTPTRCLVDLLLKIVGEQNFVCVNTYMMLVALLAINAIDF